MDDCLGHIPSLEPSWSGIAVLLARFRSRIFFMTKPPIIGAAAMSRPFLEPPLLEAGCDRPQERDGFGLVRDLRRAEVREGRACVRVLATVDHPFGAGLRGTPLWLA